ncbi:hypothetical protein F4808DRAFT_131781 [Astrocystis sublimbata]|nr:hypothetical protein F4808DRAFT_131781 [Astrocystis sublimbata]
MLGAMFATTRPKKKVTFHRPEVTEVSPEPEYLRSPPNNSDTSSTCAVVGSSDELKNFDSPKSRTKARDKEKMSTADESSDAAPEWSREEDRMICVRKSEDISWADIGKELGRRRRDCQKRHRVLAAHARELGITTAKLAKLFIDEDEGDSKSKKKKRSKDREDEKVSKTDNDKSDKSKAKAESKSPPKSENKSRSKKSKKRASETSSESKSNSDPDSDSSSDNDNSDSEAEFWAQRRYVYDTLHGEIYPRQKILRPDRFYSESDCRVLAGLEARYRANKWLYIQADFCNATGRMVDSEILRAKFEE